MPGPRFAHCLFCDDIRVEVGNKQSLMGIYIGDIVLSGIPQGAPLQLPKFAICVWLFSDWGDYPEYVEIRVYTPPGKTEVLKMRTPRDQMAPPTPIFDDPARLALYVPLQFANFVFMDEGEIEVVVETEQGALKAGRLRVRMPERPGQTPETSATPSTGSPTASRPPSEQSPDAAPETEPSRARRRPSIRRFGRTPDPE